MLEAGGGGTTVVLYCRLDLMPLTLTLTLTLTLNPTQP